MTDIPKPSAAVVKSTAELIQAAGRFAAAARDQDAADRPADYAHITDAFAKGLVEMVVVVGVNPGSYSAQLCADVGSKRHIIATVPVGGA